LRATGNSASNEPNAKFVDFIRRLFRVPHAEIKAKLDAEKTAKRSKCASRLLSLCLNGQLPKYSSGNV